MNQGFKLIVASVALGAALLTACGSKGGGGGNASPGPAACVPDASGNCVAGVGAAGYVGDGRWNGRIMVQSVPALQQFAYENGLCYGSECQYISGYIDLQLTLNSGGCLPGPGNFAIKTFRQGYAGRTISRRGDAYVNAANNGFLINYTSGQDQQQWSYPYGQQQIPPTQPGQQTVGTMQINTQWVDATKSTLNVQITYRGQPVATGQVFGYSQAQYAGAQAAAMCTGGWGQNPYTPYPTPAGWNQNPYYIWSGQYYYPYGRRN